MWYILEVNISMGSAFLKEPIRDKTTHKYQHRKIRVITTEMQGNCSLI